MMVQSRRDVLKLSAAAAGIGAMGGLSACVTAAEQATASSPIPGHVASAVPTRAMLDGWLKQLHNFGPIRATGTPQCRAFEEFLGTEFTKLGCAIDELDDHGVLVMSAGIAAALGMSVPQGWGWPVNVNVTVPAASVATAAPAAGFVAMPLAGQQITCARALLRGDMVLG